MKLKDIFKKKKEEEKKAEEKKEKKQAPVLEKPKRTAKDKKKEIEKKEDKKENKGEEKPAFAKETKRGIRIAPLVLESPHIAEKPTRLAELNQYVFKVYQETNKTQIKKAIEEVYGVDVVKVRIIKVPAKRRRIGRTTGYRKGYKKAIVKIKEGQKIEILPR